MLLGIATGDPAQPELSSAAALVRSITLIPWVVPGIVAATTWAWMFHTEFGIINYMLTGPGIIDEAGRLADQQRHRAAGR